MLPSDHQTLEGLHLFFNPYSNCSQRVMLAIAEKELAVELHEVDLLKGEQLSLEYHAINATCDVPAIVDHGRAMGDSVTILRYLEHRFPDKSLTPTDDTEKADMELLLDAAAASHMNAIVPWLYTKGYGRLPTPDQKAFYDQYVPHRSQFHNDRLTGKTACDLKAQEEIVNRDFSLLEQRLAKQRYLTGEHYTLADIAWFPNAFLLHRVFAFPLKPFPLCSVGWPKLSNARHLSPVLKLNLSLYLFAYCVCWQERFDSREGGNSRTPSPLFTDSRSYLILNR